MIRWNHLLAGLATAAVGLSVCHTAAAQLSEDQLAQRKGEGLAGRFKGSYLASTYYLGTGTFISDPHADNPLFSWETLLYPRFRLRRGMDLRAYWVLECEVTEPDNPTGRRCSPSDLRLSYHLTDLWTDPWLNGRLMGSLQLWLPTSYESRFNHTVVNSRVGVTYIVRLAEETVELAYGFVIQKYFPTRKVRGFGAADSPGEDLPTLVCRSSAGADGSCGSGGPMNDNWLLVNSAHVGYYFLPNLSLSVDLLVFNYIRFATPEPFSDPSLPTTGRHDATWGIVDLSYQPLGYLVLSLGISSQQPALTADSRSLRFPFYDFISPHNNYTKWYMTATYLY